MKIKDDAKKYLNVSGMKQKATHQTGLKGDAKKDDSFFWALILDEGLIKGHLEASRKGLSSFLLHPL